MSKYIDVNKLKAKIDSFMDNLWKVLPNCSNVEAGELSVREASDLGAYKALESVTYMIDSLQQEQPEGGCSEKPNDLLSEAAKDSWAVYEYRESPKGLYSTCYVDGFKAGAEWMAGQFQKIEGYLVDWYSTSDGKDYCCGIKTDEAFEIPEGFYIRKKQ